MSEQLWICPGKGKFMLACDGCKHSERHKHTSECVLDPEICPTCVPVTDTEEERDDD